MASQRRRLCRAITTIALPVAGLGAALAVLPATSARAQTIGANLKVLSPRAGDALGTTSFSLDVAFHSVSANAPVTTAELWVDGVRWARRDLQTPQVKNVLSFAVDASSLGDGQHTLLVRVVCSNGSVGEVVYPVTAGNNAGTVSGDPNGPDLNFRSPNNGRRVMGRVELSIDSPAKDGANPFVTIYVDKQFKTLMNMPPYTYTWDTSTVPNGFHTLEATGYLESTNQSTTRTIRVLVDNAGGDTEYKKEIPDLSVKHATPVSSVARSVAVPLTGRSNGVSKTSSHAAPILRATSAVVSAKSSDVVASPISGIAPVYGEATAANWSRPSQYASISTRVDHLGVAAPALASNPPILLGSQGYAVATANTVFSAESIISAAGARDHQAAGRIETGEASHTLAAPTVVLRFAAPRQLSDIHLVQAPPAQATNAASVVAFPLIPANGRSHGHARASQPGARVAVRQSPNGAVTAVFGGKLTTVAFNGQQIAFDVQPRVEAGLPLAPFRQIFEHTGGQVDWAERTQVVHAVNADKEIVITVGKDQAVVNGEQVKMDRAAFVEKGRTIVPLSFVGTALNVKINYDPSTGRLEITSK